MSKRSSISFAVMLADLEVAMLRAPKWGPLREVTAQLAVQFYTHERYLAGAPYLALALSAATPNFLE